MERITNADIAIQMRRLELTARQAGITGEFHLWPGKASMKIPNRIVLSYQHGDHTHRTQLFADGMAGYTVKEAWNGIRLLIAAYASVVDQPGNAEKRARVTN